MGNKNLENHALVGCPIDIFSLGETNSTFNFDVTLSEGLLLN